jgi:hypothetical protein
MPLVVAGLVLRERSLRASFRDLPVAEAGDLDSSRQRLHALEAFLGSHPVWHGTLSALSERSRLRVEVARLEDLERMGHDRERVRLAERGQNAELLRSRAHMRIDAGDFAGALEDLHEVLRVAPAGWPHRERVERDVQAVHDYLSEEHR